MNITRCVHDSAIVSATELNFTSTAQNFKLEIYYLKSGNTL